MGSGPEETVVVAVEAMWLASAAEDVSEAVSWLQVLRCRSSEGMAGVTR
jgi:hypothetical protein